MRAAVPEIDLSDPAVLADPLTAYGRAREVSPVARLVAPGFAMWAILRHEEARAALTDPRLAPNSDSYLRLDVPEHCRPYLRTMQEQDGPGHLRLRRAAAPAFAPKKAEAFRPRAERIVTALLDALPGGTVDLLAEFARPLPIEVICALAGVPEADRPRWRAYGATISDGAGPAFLSAIPDMITAARATVDAGQGLVPDLLSSGLDETETVTLVWHLVLAGQTPGNLIANSVAALLTHPDQLADLAQRPRADAFGRRGADQMVHPACPHGAPVFPAGHRVRRRHRPRGRTRRGVDRLSEPGPPRVLRARPSRPPARGRARAPRFRARPPLLPGSLVRAGHHPGGAFGSVEPFPRPAGGRGLPVGAGSGHPPPGSAAGDDLGVTYLADAARRDLTVAV